MFQQKSKSVTAELFHAAHLYSPSSLVISSTIVFNFLLASFSKHSMGINLLLKQEKTHNIFHLFMQIINEYVGEH